MKALDASVKQALLSPFQASEIRIRSKPSIMPYITARVVMTRLDEVVPFQWSFSMGDHWYDEKGIFYQSGTLTLRDDASVVTYSDVGSAAPDGAGPAKQVKGAASDCLKRCAVHAGVARYIYELPKENQRADGLLKSHVQKAVLAVGWRGEITEAHWGKIGGVRALDSEDEDEDDGSPPEPPSRRPSPSSQVAHPASSAHGTSQPPASPETVGPSEDAKQYFLDLCAELGLRTGAEKRQYFGSLGLASLKTAEQFEQAIGILEDHRNRLDAMGNDLDDEPDEEEDESGLDPDDVLANPNSPDPSRSSAAASGAPTLTVDRETGEVTEPDPFEPLSPDRMIDLRMDAAHAEREAYPGVSETERDAQSQALRRRRGWPEVVQMTSNHLHAYIADLQRIASGEPEPERDTHAVRARKAGKTKAAAPSLIDAPPASSASASHLGALRG